MTDRMDDETCPGCGSSHTDRKNRCDQLAMLFPDEGAYEPFLMKCRFCGGDKCVVCDLGSNVQCLLCDDDPEDDE